MTSTSFVFAALMLSACAASQRPVADSADLAALARERQIIRLANEGQHTRDAQNPDRTEAMRKCRASMSTNDYACDASGIYMLDDVRHLQGFHAIAKLEDEHGRTYLHVADSCQHFICAIDQDCLGKGGTDDSCLQGTGCCVASVRESLYYSGTE